MHFDAALCFASLSARFVVRVSAILVLLLWGIGLQAAAAQEILIVRPLTNSKFEVREPEIDFAVRISAFDLITRVEINGEAIAIRPSPTLTVNAKIRLEPGENTIEVEVETEGGSATKEFVIRYVSVIKPKAVAAKQKEKDHFQLISVLGVESSTNVLKQPAVLGETSGNRFFLVLIPRYDWFPGERDTLRLQSIISRDQYDDEQFAGEEIAFTQLTLSWISGFGQRSSFTLGTAYETIFQTYDTVLQGETEQQNNAILFTSLRVGVGDKPSYLEFGLEIKDQQQTEEQSDQDRNEDALLTTLHATLVGSLFGLKSKTKLAVAENDADGKLKDKTVLRLSEELSHPFGSFVPGFGFRARHNEFKEPDPDFDDETPTETLLTYFVNGLYAFSSSWILTLEVLTETQSSNVEASEYDNSSFSTSIIYVF